MGKSKNATNKTISTVNNPKNNVKPAVIKSVLIIIPIKIEKPTSPSLYSFFQGLKNVLIIKGSENALKKDLLRDKR